MAQPCPRIDPLRPPTLGRNLPGVLQYGATCLPGTASASGCADDQKFFAILIPWDKVVTEGWTAPGGNRYWASSVAANTFDPLAAALLRLMADRSRMHVQSTFRREDYRDIPMRTILERYRGKLATSHGVINVEKMPDPNETAGNFVNRGGYLLWIDPGSGAFTSKVPIDWYKPTWLPSDVYTCQLYAFYNLTTNRIEYSVRVSYKDAWEKVAAATLGQLGKAVGAFCGTISSDKAIAASIAIGLYPGAQAYVAAWGAATAMCNLPQAVCEPRPDQQPAAPITATGSWKMMTASGSSGGAASTHGMISPGVLSPTGQPTVQTPRYPEGTIAVAAVAGYDVAIPQPGGGTTHVMIGKSIVIPLGVTLVTRSEWERATLPFWRRSSTKIGAMIGTVAAASALTVYASRRG